MTRVLVIGAGCALLLLALAFVILRPSFVQATKDYRAAVLADLAARARSYRDATGAWPASLQEMAPPLCRHGSCMLSSDELQRVGSAWVSAGVLCVDHECVEMKSGSPVGDTGP